jgi:hypothetical protein
MKKAILILCVLLMAACAKEQTAEPVTAVNWDARRASVNSQDSLLQGSTYLSVYSEIYSLVQHKTHNLTVTVSMRNVNKTDSIYIRRAEYFDSGGNSIRTYFDFPIYLKPMETVEIVINEVDKKGGTGGNFVFDWYADKNSNEPFFEGIMISTSGQQGLSFTTQGKRID